MITKKLSLLLIFFVTNAISGPISVKDGDNGRLVIDKNIFREEFIIYKAEHDIVDIIIPINALNLFKDTKVDMDVYTDVQSNNEDVSKNVTMFFVEADIKQNSIEYKGLSVSKDGKVKKLLENGRDAVSGDIGTKYVYFAATDGLYSYDSEKNEAKKYGSIDDNLIAITKVYGSDILYVINNKNELFKVTEKGTKKELVSNVKGVKQIVFILNETLLYVDDNNDIYLMKETGLAKISGLPVSKTSLKLLRPLVFTDNHDTIAIVDKTPYVIYINGTAEKLNIEFKVKPTAYAMDLTLLQWFAVDKNLYVMKIWLSILETDLHELSYFMNSLAIDMNAVVKNMDRMIKTTSKTVFLKQPS